MIALLLFKFQRVVPTYIRFVIFLRPSFGAPSPKGIVRDKKMHLDIGVGTESHMKAAPLRRH